MMMMAITKFWMDNWGVNLALGIVKTVVRIYDVVTLPIYLLVQRPWEAWQKQSVTRAALMDPKDPWSPYVRIEDSQDNPFLKMDTIDELFRKAVTANTDKKCFGYREVLGEEEEPQPDGKIFKKLVLGDYKWLTFKEVDERVDNLSKGLMAIGVRPKHTIVLFAETRLEWMLTAQASFRISVQVATLYATLGEDGIVHGINETEVTHLVTSAELLPKLKKIISRLPLVRYIIYMEGVSKPDTRGFPDTVKILPFRHVEDLGTTVGRDLKGQSPTAKDISIIMYTSGSTGIPKGVMVAHENLVATIAGFYCVCPKTLVGDVFIAYLPLAHSFELATECFFLSNGVPIGYSSPNTMTDKSTAVKKGCKGDASVLQPTVLTSVPLVLDRIRKSVNEVIESSGFFAKSLFAFAIQYKQWWMKWGFGTPIIDRIVFKKVKQLVGGRVRIVASGGAPLSPDTHEFIRTCLSCKVIQGYGLTETAASTAIMDLDDSSTGRVGAPLTGVYVKLADWDEGGYHATDKPHPRGEIIIGGRCVALGYFKNEALTRECFSEEDGIRWFSSGDIGEIYPDGTIKIIDRKKDLVKLQYGEYISLGKVETELKTCPVVDNICVYGNSYHDYLVALIVPNHRQIKLLAAELGKIDNIPELYYDPDVIAEVFKCVRSHALKCNLQKTEIPAKIKLCAEEWVPDTGLVTAAFKIRRNMIQQFYKKDIDAMYGVKSNGPSKST